MTNSSIGSTTPKKNSIQFDTAINATLVATAEVPKPVLKREINQLGFVAITLNGVIGGGLFALPALVAAKVGLFSPCIWGV